MLDHIILTVSDVERSLKFYTAALTPLKIRMFLPYKGADGHPDLWGFGDGQKAFFWLKHGTPDPASIHWGFMAENSKAVDAFYKAAIAAGATDNISPRARLGYYPGYCAADVLFLRRIIGSMFMRVNLKCAHQVRPPLTVERRLVTRRRSREARG